MSAAGYELLFLSSISSSKIGTRWSPEECCAVAGKGQIKNGGSLLLTSEVPLWVCFRVRKLRWELNPEPWQGSPPMPPFMNSCRKRPLRWSVNIQLCHPPQTTSGACSAIDTLVSALYVWCIWLMSCCIGLNSTTQDLRLHTLNVKKYIHLST